MWQKLCKILNKEVPNWLRNLTYVFLVLDTILVVIIALFPELWSKFIMLF